MKCLLGVERLEDRWLPAPLVLVDSPINGIGTFVDAAQSTDDVGDPGLTQNKFSLQEGASATYYVKLGADPGGTVQVSLETSGPMSLFLNGSAATHLLFTSENFDTWQAIKVTSPNDRIDSTINEQMSTISYAVIGGTGTFAVPTATQVTVQDANTSWTSQAAALSIMKRVANWQLAHPSRHPVRDWTNGALYTGMMALAGIAGTPKYRNAMIRMGDSTGWRLGPRGYVADDHLVGQTYLELYMQLHKPKMLAPTKARFDTIMANPVDDNLEFNRPGRGNKWSWCDSLFMAPPTWARLAAATGEQKYLDFANRLFWLTKDFLYDQQEHLFFRDSNQFERREANGAKVFWSRGNGWVMAGLARMLPYIPADYPDRPKYEQLFKEMAAKIITLQQSDGLWRASLLDPEHYPLKETSGSGFYCFALAWGINNGLLDRAEYEPVVHKAWTALTACVTKQGMLTHVQAIGTDPRKFPPMSTEVYAVGAFLLAGSEVQRLVATPAG